MRTNRKRRHRRPAQSWFGNVMLELVAVAAFLLVLVLSNTGSEHAVDASSDYEIADLPTAITGFLSDQVRLQIKN